TMDFASLFPDLKPWVQSLGALWPAQLIKSSSWAFPVIQTFHLLAFATLGGAVLMPSLRLMGVGMTSVPPATIEQTVRPWLIGALCVISCSRFPLGLVVARRLSARTVFLVKMFALGAGLILWLGVVRSVPSREGMMTLPAKLMAAVALLLWLVAIFIFGTTI